MTVALSVVTVANSIAALSISGVTLRDIDEIPQSGALILPVLFPQPNEFVTDINPENQSFGGGSIAKMDFSYTLHYVFLFAEAGSGVGGFDSYAALIAKLELIWETIMTNDIVTGLVDMKLNGVEGLGTIQDPSGNSYWGALFSLRCLEFAQ